MKKVLEIIEMRAEQFSSSDFLRLVQDPRYTPRERLGFLAGMAPFVLGCTDLIERLLEEEEGSSLPSGGGVLRSLFLEDLKALGLQPGECPQAHQSLEGLMALTNSARPLQREVILLALEAVGFVALRGLEPIAREFVAREGRRLASLDLLRTWIEEGPWSVEAVELGLLPEMEQEAVKTVGDVFDQCEMMADGLVAYAQLGLGVRAQPLESQRTVEHGSNAELTFQEFGNARLQALCQAVGYGAEDLRTLQRFFTAMSSPWGTRRIGSVPTWLSDITDDHTPFEFSLALEGSYPEVRFLIEAQNEPTTIQSSWEDGLALNERLNQEFGIPLDRFELVKDLFEPTDPGVRFALWHAFCLKPGGEPEVKVYFNPLARGREHSRFLVEEALARLGFRGAWRFLSEVAMRRGPQDYPVYFSLDLSDRRAARIKIYLAHEDASAEDIEKAMSQAREYIPGEARAFCQTLQGHQSRFEAPRATLTCWAFTSEDDARPYSATLHCPIRCYSTSDQDSMERIRAVLNPQSYAMLDRALHALARRPLEDGVGLIQWASMRRVRGHVRSTFYLATEAYGAGAQRTSTTASSGTAPKVTARRRKSA